MTEASALALINSALEGVRDDIRDLRVDGSERGRRIYEKFDQQGEALAEQKRELESLQARMTDFEDAMRAAAPALKELSETKLRAEGAGWLGRLLWKLGMALISGAAGIYFYWEKIVATIRWLVR